MVMEERKKKMESKNMKKKMEKIKLKKNDIDKDDNKICAITVVDIKLKLLLYVYKIVPIRSKKII